MCHQQTGKPERRLGKKEKGEKIENEKETRAAIFSAKVFRQQLRIKSTFFSQMEKQYSSGGSHKQVLSQEYRHANQRRHNY